MQTNMLRNAAIAALLTTASAVSTFAADYAPFARVEVTYTDSGYDYFRRSASGLGVDGGYFAIGTQLTIGAIFKESHEFSVTTGYTKWDGDTFGPAGVASIAYQAEQIPLLLNYRIHFSITEKITAYAGPSGGFVREIASADVFENVGPVVGLKPVGSYRDSAWKTALGGSVGISYAITQRWKIDMAVHALRLNSKNYDLAGSNANERYEGATRVGFSVGADFRW